MFVVKPQLLKPPACYIIQITFFSMLVHSFLQGLLHSVTKINKITWILLEVYEVHRL
jgi:hypothetical protein